MENSHEGEGTEDTGGARDGDGDAVFGEGVADGAVGKRRTRGSESVVPSLGPKRILSYQSREKIPYVCRYRSQLTHQKPVKLSARYKGPNKAGLLLYLKASWILVQMI